MTKSMISADGKQQYRCRTCGMIRPASRFLKNPAMTQNGGIDPMCIACRNRAERKKKTVDKLHKANKGYGVSLRRLHENAMLHMRPLVLERDENRCRICGFAEFLEVHHITPIAKKGWTAMDNLITLCPNHHRAAHRGAVTRRELYDLVEGCMTDDDLRAAVPTRKHAKQVT